MTAKVYGWTRCSEKLPEVDLPVLALFRNGDIRVCERRTEEPGFEDTYQAFDYWDEVHNEGQIIEDDDIAGWQPLPEGGPEFLQLIAGEEVNDQE